MQCTVHYCTGQLVIGIELHRYLLHWDNTGTDLECFTLTVFYVTSLYLSRTRRCLSDTEMVENVQDMTDGRKGSL